MIIMISFKYYYNSIIIMNKKEFLELRNKLQQFEEEHSLELITDKETQALNLMISIMTDYITHFNDNAELSMAIQEEKRIQDLLEM